MPRKPPAKGDYVLATKYADGERLKINLTNHTAETFHITTGTDQGVEYLYVGIGPKSTVTLSVNGPTLARILSVLPTTKKYAAQKETHQSVASRERTRKI